MPMSESQVVLMWIVAAALAFLVAIHAPTLIPSLSEVQPMVVLEALSCGVPVIATRSTKFFDELTRVFTQTEFNQVSLPESFKDGDVGIVTLAQKEVEELALRLVSAVDSMTRYDDQQRAILSQKATNAGLVDSIMYARYLALYQQAIEEASIIHRVRVTR